MKTLLSIDELIQHIKKKGVSFHNIDESEARSFLIDNNYYFKLSAYRKNFEKYQTGPKAGEYINLDFSYLKELSILDMHLRKIIMRLSLDLEHSLKVWLINDINKHYGKDAYSLVEEFCKHKQKCVESIKRHSNSKYINNLYASHEPNFPIWAFLEMISFGDLIFLIQFYNNKFPGSFDNVSLLFNASKLRNACAHSNCLINDVNLQTSHANNTLKQYISNISNITKSSRQKYLKNHFVLDFVSLLYLFEKTVKSKGIKSNAYEDLHIFFTTRCLDNKDYFKQNEKLKGLYNFLALVIDSCYQTV